MNYPIYLFDLTIVEVLATTEAMKKQLASTQQELVATNRHLQETIELLSSMLHQTLPSSSQLNGIIVSHISIF